MAIRPYKIENLSYDLQKLHATFDKTNGLVTISTNLSV